jgi:hypothetical protein
MPLSRLIATFGALAVIPHSLARGRMELSHIPMPSNGAKPATTRTRLTVYIRSEPPNVKIILAIGRRELASAPIVSTWLQGG